VDLYDEWAARARAAASLSDNDVARLVTEAASTQHEARRAAESNLITGHASWILHCIREHAGLGGRVLLRSSGPERSELVADACAAFLRAIRRLARRREDDPSIADRSIADSAPTTAIARLLLAYSAIRIRSAMYRYVVARWDAASVDVVGVRRRVRRAAESIAQRQGRPPTATQVADLLAERAMAAIRARRGVEWRPRPRELWRAGAVTPATVARYLAHRPQVISLDALIRAEDGISIDEERPSRMRDVIADPNERVDDRLLREEQSDAISRIVTVMDPRDPTPHLRRLMIEMQYGLNGRYSYTAEEIAAVTGTSPRRVHQLNANTMRRAARLHAQHTARPSPTSPTHIETASRRLQVHRSPK
jgi:DNA-directed RNA polymerase specialized sigma subunit